jgi:hypothetical protein
LIDDNPHVCLLGPQRLIFFPILMAKPPNQHQPQKMSFEAIFHRHVGLPERTSILKTLTII